MSYAFFNPTYGNDDGDRGRYAAWLLIRYTGVDVGARTHSRRSARGRSREQIPYRWTLSPSLGGSIAARSERGRQRPLG